MKDLTIRTNDLTKIFGNPTPLVVWVTDDNVPLSGKEISITIHGVSYPRTTGTDGRTSLSINLEPGSYPCTITFNGDSDYNPTTKSVVVRVIRNDKKQKAVKDSDHYFEVNKMALKVIMDSGFSTTMGTDVKETDLLYFTETMNRPTFFFNSGDSGIEFEVSVVIMPEYTHNNISYRDVLDQWNKFLIPVSVVTDAIDVPNGKYIMTIKSKKQTDKKKSIWKLRFKQYYENSNSFENLYTERLDSISAIDVTLLNYQTIDRRSPKTAILALQQKLDSYGCFRNYKIYQLEDGSYASTPYGWGDVVPRSPNGIWDEGMIYDLAMFQHEAGIPNQGDFCDRQTIIALVSNNYADIQGYYWSYVTD